MDGALYFFVILLFVFAILGGVLRFVLSLLFSYTAFKRQRALIAEQQRLLAAELSQSPQQNPSPHSFPQPITDPNNIHIPGGPSIVNGRLHVPGVSPQWKR
jgi:hypothetical protein